MKLVGVEHEGRIEVAALDGAQLVLLGDRDRFWSDPGAGAPAAGAARIDAAGATLHPAIPLSARVICVGLNYREHAREANMPVPETPVVFGRWARSLIADGVAAPAMEAPYDWEGELGVVIGKAGRGIAESQANEHIYGYCAFNDLSCRRLQMETPQWTLGKNSDASGPIGAVVSQDESGDPASGWAVTTHVNGERVQNGITTDLIFTVPRIVAFVSRAMTLMPGDLIITGTPSGVGAGFKPPRFLKPGDVVRVEVGPLGAVTTPIVAPD